MKKFASLILAALFLFAAIPTSVGASGSEPAPKGKVLCFNDIAFASGGSMGYAVNNQSYTMFTGSEEEVPAGQRFSEKGITVAFDVMVSDLFIEEGGRFSQIPFFVNGTAPYNYAAFNFTLEHRDYAGHMAFEIYSGAWPVYDNTLEDTYIPWCEEPFDWELGKWYRMAVRFEKNIISVYLNGEWITEWDFDNNDHAFILMYPQNICAYFDNFVTATAAYDLENEQWRDNPEVYDYIDFQRAFTGSGVSAGDWSFTTEAYSVVDLEDIILAKSSLVVGDADGDGEITLKDVVLIIRHCAGYTDKPIDEDASDVDEDDSVGLVDVVHIIRNCSGFEDNPCGVGTERITYGSVIYE